MTRTSGSARISTDGAGRFPADPDALLLYRLLLAADALGGLDRMLARTVTYARNRVAFGRPIGGFQAVQHRLVDHSVRVRGMELLVSDAARALAAPGPGHRSAGGAQRGCGQRRVGGGAARSAPAHGAIGFTWEHGLHLYERRAHQDARLATNPRSAPTDARRARRMDRMTPDLDEFRAGVRAFVSGSGPRLRQEGLRMPLDAAEEQAIRSWLAELYERGYLGGGWPVEWGGRDGHLPVHDLVVMEELIRSRAYRPLDQVMLAAHAILTFGTEAQKHDLLPRIRKGEHIWCQLFSEPDAGSDLASLRTRAVVSEGSFTVTGQKVWSTDAQWADMGMLLARTDPTVDRHAGLTAFVVPMDLPGIEIRPIREMTGSEEFCEVFLDEVQLGEEHVLGEVGGGWAVISSGLASERAFVGANALQLEMMYDDLVSLARAARLPDGSVARPTRTSSPRSRPPW